VDSGERGQYRYTHKKPTRCETKDGCRYAVDCETPADNRLRASYAPVLSAEHEATIHNPPPIYVLLHRSIHTPCATYDIRSQDEEGKFKHRVTGEEDAARTDGDWDRMGGGLTQGAAPQSESHVCGRKLQPRRGRTDAAGERIFFDGSTSPTRSVRISASTQERSRRGRQTSSCCGRRSQRENLEGVIRLHPHLQSRRVRTQQYVDVVVSSASDHSRQCRHRGPP